MASKSVQEQTSATTNNLDRTKSWEVSPQLAPVDNVVFFLDHARIERSWTPDDPLAEGNHRIVILDIPGECNDNSLRYVWVRLIKVTKSAKLDEYSSQVEPLRISQNTGSYRHGLPIDQKQSHVEGSQAQPFRCISYNKMPTDKSFDQAILGHLQGKVLYCIVLRSLFNSHFSVRRNMVRGWKCVKCMEMLLLCFVSVVPLLYKTFGNFLFSRYSYRRIM